ncbi:DUF4296 domain-containing protein [Salinimicrobium flavum]|uniref:DUF4296 domain-containing protein n=1 Tax=Salinimicrobium flavum TaxID=1737065 RepID=A0ABW5IY57_9FLAO
MRYLFVLLFLLILSGCQDIHKSEKPGDLISEDKMVEVLTDISLLHGARSYNRSLMEEKGIKPEKFIYEKHGIDSLQFLKSSNYYAENYKQYQNIYGRVKERLEALKVEYDTIRIREERKRDSIRALQPKDSLELDSLNLDSLKYEKVRQRNFAPDSLTREDRSLPQPRSRENITF